MNKSNCPQYNQCDYRLEPARPCMLHIYYKCKYFDLNKWVERFAEKNGLVKEVEDA